MKRAKKKAPFTTAPIAGGKKKVASGPMMGGMLGVTPKKPEPDDKLRMKQRGARMARLHGKLI